MYYSSQLWNRFQTIYKYGRVKDLEDAFKEFPVEEEWHEGKIENILNEDSEVYSIYKYYLKSAKLIVKK